MKRFLAEYWPYVVVPIAVVAVVVIVLAFLNDDPSGAYHYNF